MAAIDRWVVARAIRMVGAELRAGRRLVVEVNISGRSAGDPELLELIEHELPAPTRSARARSSSRSPRRPRSPTSRAPSTSRPASPTSAAASRSTTSAPASAPSTTSSTCRSTTSRSTASSSATRPPTPTDQLVIQAVVDIARGLGKRTVAEYVGDSETAELLRRMGVDHAQGFHLGEPAPLGDWLPEAEVALA